MSTTAFALAGLGGFNAHGAGFLAAARHHGRIPDFVTATSGQILILTEWLRGTDLRPFIVDEGRENNPFAQWQVALFGLPHVFHPAYAERLRRFWGPWRSGEDALTYWADRLLPAQAYVPDRSRAFFEQAAATLEAASVDGRPIGVMFNAYDLESGRGVLYGNRRARTLLPEEGNLPAVRLTDDPRLYPERPPSRSLAPITPEALAAALWLSLYGFENLPGGQMDGAYHRACLVAELHGFDEIFVARSLATGWTGARRPGNAFEVQDWQTEMWFSASYKAEIDAMLRINQLIEQGHLKDPRFKKVRLYETAPKTPAGYFHYFVERHEVFDCAYRQALARFAEAEA